MLKLYPLTAVITRLLGQIRSHSVRFASASKPISCGQQQRFSTANGVIYVRWPTILKLVQQLVQKHSRNKRKTRISKRGFLNLLESSTVGWYRSFARSLLGELIDHLSISFGRLGLANQTRLVRSTYVRTTSYGLN